MIVCENLEHDLSVLMKKKDGVVDQLGKGVRALVTKKGVTCIEGTARILANGEIDVEGKSAGKYSAKEIVIATGSKPVELPFLPYDGKVVVNSDHGIAFDRVPQKMAVVGAGAIGLELGCVWSRLGTEVEIIEFLLRSARSGSRNVQDRP